MIGVGTPKFTGASRYIRLVREHFWSYSAGVGIATTSLNLEQVIVFNT